MFEFTPLTTINQIWPPSDPSTRRKFKARGRALDTRLQEASESKAKRASSAGLGEASVMVFAGSVPRNWP